MRLGQGNFRLNPRKFIALGADPYVVPLSFGFAEEGGRIKIYFHGAKAGMKHDLIRANPLYAPNLTSCAVTRRFRAASRRNTRV
jgi:hypothetical protein